MLLQNRTFAHEKEMYRLQNQAEENVKAVILDMLNHRKFVRRSFDAISKRVGGYSDDEIRRLLHEVNAKRSGMSDGEWWYLADREDEYIESRRRGGDT